MALASWDILPREPAGLIQIVKCFIGKKYLMKRFWQGVPDHVLP